MMLNEGQRPHFGLSARTILKAHSIGRFSAI